MNRRRAIATFGGGFEEESIVAVAEGAEERYAESYIPSSCGLAIRATN
jgi:hypothetical protein